MPGLNAISNLISAVETVERNMVGGSYVSKAVRQNTNKIIEMNVGQLYDYGINSLGVSINTYAPYAPYTIQLKSKKGQPVDRVTLRDTGAFHESFYVVVGANDFYITATDNKTDELVSKYGGNIFGLTDENKTDLAHNHLFPVVMDEIRKEIFG